MLSVPNIGKISGALFILLEVTVVPYLIAIHPNYDLSLAKFTAMTSLGTTPETAWLFNPLLVVQGLLLLAYFNLYFGSSRDIYSKIYGWKAIRRLHNVGALGTFMVGLFPDNDPFHIPHVVGAALSFGAISFAIVTISFNHLAMFKKGLTRAFGFMGSFGIIIMFIGFSFTSIFIFINVNQGLWQTTHLILLLLWYGSEFYIYRKWEADLQMLDIETLKQDSLIYLKRSLIIIGIYGLSIFVIGSIGLVDIEILSKCNSSCKPNLADYQVLFGFGIIFGVLITLIRKTTPGI